MLEGKVMPFNMAPIQILLDGFDLKFGMQDHFNVLYKCFTSFQLIVEIIQWTRDCFALKCKLPIYLVIT